MMYSVSTELYLEVADRIREALGGGSYFSGTLAFGWEGIECRLTASLIAYRTTVRYPEGDRDELCDLVPVWWEFHTVDSASDELLNDFSFSTLRSFL